MRRMLVSVGAAALLVASASLAIAQGPGGPGAGGPGGRRAGAFGRQGGMMGGGMMGGGLMLLRMPEVQTELKMTQPQIAKIDSAQQTMFEAMREGMQGGPGQRSPEEMQAAMAKFEELQAKAVTSILDQTQIKRFRQLELQRQGPGAVMRPAVAKELGVTAQQQAKIRELQQKQMEEMRSMFQGGRGQMTPEERQDMAKKMQENRTKNQQAVLGVLTPAQKTKWTEMLGKPFKFPEGGPGMFGGVRRNRQGGAPGGPGGPGGAPPF